MRFQDKVAIVTGAGRGIGEAYAHALAGEGAAVVCADLHEESGGRVAADIVRAGGRATFVRTDVASERSTLAMGRAAVDAFGGVDFLVNNAAIYGGMEMHGVLDVPIAYWQRFMAVNMTGALLATRSVYRSMADRGGGAIVNQSATAAWMGRGYHGIAKLGLHGVTQTLARELGPMNIRVNALAPGPVDTESTRATLDGDVLREALLTTPLGRIGTTDDVTGPCLFLLSDEAKWITGHILNVDGGQVMRV